MSKKQTKDMNRDSTEEETHMVNELKSCPISLIITDCKSKPE